MDRRRFIAGLLASSALVRPASAQLTTMGAGGGFGPAGGGGGGTAPTLDGSVIQAAGDFGGSNTCVLPALTTTSANGLIVVVIACEATGTPHATVSSVTATGLTFTQRASIYQDSIAGPFGTTWNTLEVWSAPALIAQVAKVITVTVSKTIDCGMCGAFGTKVDGITAPTWTSNSPVTASSSGTSAPSVGSVASNKAALLVGFANSAVDTIQTIGSGFTMINTQFNPNGAVAMALGEEYKSFSSATSGQTVAFGTSWQTWAIIADAIEGT